MKSLYGVVFMLAVVACGSPPSGGDSGVTQCNPSNNFCQDAGNVTPDAGTAADSGTATDAGIQPDAGSSPDAGKPDSGTTVDAGLTLIGGWLGTVNAAPSPSSGLQLVDQGLEFTPQTCNGNYCLNGGIVP